MAALGQPSTSVGKQSASETAYAQRLHLNPYYDSRTFTDDDHFLLVKMRAELGLDSRLRTVDSKERWDGFDYAFAMRQKGISPDSCAKSMAMLRARVSHIELSIIDRIREGKRTAAELRYMPLI
jgi:hypothetical protein